KAIQCELPRMRLKVRSTNRIPWNLIDEAFPYIASGSYLNPFPKYSAINLIYFTDHCNPNALKPVHCFP
ncbi:MAG TPA: hypothetical protein VEP90_07115, partial [Methylomirabilota bacterium]|nr:hypothetical protein [Methylomirabilota bacterium]